MKKFISFLIAFSVLTSLFVCLPLSASAVTVPSAKLTDYKTIPDYDNIFTLESDINTEYVLLDKLSDGWLVMTNRVYDAVPFDTDGAQKFDEADENNIGYYLNNTFLNEVLPEEMRPYIAEKSWETEAGNGSGNCPQKYAPKCKISLLSFDEYSRYYKKFGTVDHNNEIDWWLRTGDGAKSGNVIAGGGVYANWGKHVSLDATASGGVRPIFVLSEEFFENVRLNTLKIGENVKKSINRNIKSDALLKAGYDEIKLRRLGYKNVRGADEYVDVIIPNEPHYMQDHEYSYFEVDIAQSGKNSVNYTVEYIIDGGEKQVLELTAAPRKQIRKKVSLKDVLKGVHQLDIKVYKGEELVGYNSASICLIDYYKRTPLDKYTRYAINAVAWQVEENASRNRTSMESFLSLSDRLAEAGFTKVRFSPEWGVVESERGVYRFGDNVYDRSKSFAKNGITINPYLIAYGNQKITKREISHKMAAPNTRDAIEAYVDYGIGAQKYFNNLYNSDDAFEAFEVWNEPNISVFWQPSPNFLEYSQLLNASAFNLNKKSPDTGIMAGSITAEKNQEIFEIMHRNGLLMYADQISIHPYTYPNDPDVRHIVRTPQYLEAFERYGGWMDVALTEIGWPTHQAYNTTTKEQQAIYMIKLLVYSDEMGFSFTDIFSARDNGLQKSYVEHGFGIFEYDDKPKPSVASLSFFNNMTADAVYVGEFDITDGVRSFLYKKPGERKPYAVCWVSEEGKEKAYTLKSGEYATDLFGNRLDEKTITIGKSPVYIFSLSETSYMNAISHDISAIHTELCEKLGDKFDFSELKNLSERAAKSSGKYSDTKLFIDEYFSLAEKYIHESMADEDTSYENTALIAYIMFKKGESMAASLENMNLSYTSALDSYKKIQKAVADKKGDEPDSALLYTDAMLRYAYKYNNRISDIKAMKNFSGKKERMGYYGYIIDKVCGLANAMIGYEVPDSSKAIFTYTTQTRQSMYKGVGYSMKATLENLRNKDFNGTAVWVDENGEEIGEEIPLFVKSGEYADFEIKCTAPLIRDAGTYFYKILYKEDSEIVKSQEIEVTLKSLVDLDLVNAQKPLSGLDAITVEVKNTFDSTMTGKLVLESPDGWVIESEKEISVPSGETHYIDFKIDEFVRVPYNEYCFKMKVINENGEEVAMMEKMLDFLIMTYDENVYSPETFDGDISGWEDAYPIYIETPENPSDINSWIGQNRSMKVLTKWNENKLYIMADVYDAVHNNSFTGFDLWQGDSLQFAIDTLINGLAPNTKTGFQSDDYEFGFGLTPAGHETYVYFGPDIKAGQIDVEMFKVVRNDEYGLTRYLIAVPGEYIGQFKLSAGNRFGFNVAANDADILLREGYSQFTNGICDSKNPSLYKIFELVESDKDALDITESKGFYKKIEELRLGN